MYACELYWIIFRLSPKKECFGMSPAETRKISDALQNIHRRKFPSPKTTENCFIRILDTFTYPDPFAETDFHAAVQMLLCDVARTAGLFTGSSNERLTHSPRIQKVVNRLYAESGASVSLDEMAAEAGLKPSYFREQFKKETGHSPIAYLTLIRIQKAKNLLLKSNKSITAIAFELGFPSSQYFATVFHNATGQTPGRFRSQSENTPV